MVVRARTCDSLSIQKDVSPRTCNPSDALSCADCVCCISAKAKKAKMSAESNYLPPSPQSSALPFAPKTALSNISAVENASSAFREDQSPPRSILPAWRAAQSVVCRCPTADPLHRRPIVRALPARVSRANPAVLPPQTAPFPLCLRRRERDDITTRCVSCDPTR